MQKTIASLLIMAAAFSFGLGISIPLLTLDRLYFLTDQPSLIEVVAGLYSDESYLLALVVALVSILFPAAKLIWLQLAVTGLARRGLRYLHTLGRWSMMDVFLVAIVIFAAKTSGVASAFAQPGLWFYAAATISAALAASFLEKSNKPWRETVPE